MVFNATFKIIEEDISRRTLVKKIWKQKKLRLRNFTQKIMCFNYLHWRNKNKLFRNFVFYYFSRNCEIVLKNVFFNGQINNWQGNLRQHQRQPGNISPLSLTHIRFESFQVVGKY
jgi:hypothetical protein